MSRKKKISPSWLTILKNAENIFVGESLAVKDVQIPAAETSCRGAAYLITAEVYPQRLLAGSLPTEKIIIQGETYRSPDARLSFASTYFPPDALRRIDYWDYATLNVPQLVLVILSESTLIRPLDDLDDNLLEAVSTIHSWLQLPKENQEKVVMETLSKSVKNPISYVAGFELLLSNGSDASTLFENFNNLSGRPGVAIKGIIDQLCYIAPALTDSEVKALSWALIEGWKMESNPAALSGYLIYFDACRQRMWKDNFNLKAAVLAQVERIKSISFSGVDAEQWDEKVRYYASVLEAA
jgi:hypothetical protein